MPSTPSANDPRDGEQPRGLRRPDSLLTRPRPGAEPELGPGANRGAFGEERLVVETADGRRINLLPTFADAAKNLAAAEAGRAVKPPSKADPAEAFEEALAGVPPDVREAPWKASFADYFRARAALSEVPTALAGMWLKPLADRTYALIDRIPAAVRRPFDRALGILLDTVVSLPGMAVEAALPLTPDGAAPGALPGSVDLGIPAYPQLRSSCGETMVAAWLKGHGVPIALGEVDTQLPFFSGLNLLEDAELRKRDFSVVSGPGDLADLRTYLAAGYPVMVSIGWANGGGHYALVTGYDDRRQVLTVDNYRVKGTIDEVPYADFEETWARHRNLMVVAHPQKDGRLARLRQAGRLSRDAEVAEGLSISDIWVNERLELFVELAYRYKGTKDDLTVRLSVDTAEGEYGLADVFGGSIRYTHRFDADTSITVYAEKLSVKGRHDADSVTSILENVAVYVGAKHKGLSGRVGWERGAWQAELELDLNGRLGALDASARVSVTPDGQLAVSLGLSGTF